MNKKTTPNEDELRSQYNLRTIRIAARGSRRAQLLANDTQEGLRFWQR